MQYCVNNDTSVKFSKNPLLLFDPSQWRTKVFLLVLLVPLMPVVVLQVLKM
jgi:hypothetical protein